MPVTTRIITAESGSREYPQRTVRSAPSAVVPIGIHSKSVWVNRAGDPASVSAGVGAKLCSSRTAPTEIANEARTAAQATSATARRVKQRAPSRPFRRKPANGRSGISQRSRSIISPAHQAGVLDVGRPAATEQRDDDRQPDRGFGGGHGHDEEDEDVPRHRLILVREGGESQVDGVQHQLDAHQDDDGVATHQDTDAADGEQERRHEQEEFHAHQRSFRLARTTAPIMAAIRRIDAASNANWYLVNRRRPMPRAVPKPELMDSGSKYGAAPRFRIRNRTDTIGLGWMTTRSADMMATKPMRPDQNSRLASS